MIEINFIINSSPVVQKNNLTIIKINRGGKMVSFIDHSKKFKSQRNQIAIDIFSQYRKHGYSSPIDYMVDIDMVFFTTKQHEPDLDNLPAAYLDAMVYGVKDTKSKIKMAITLSDDKLVRRLTCEKIVKGDEHYVGEPRTEIRIRRYEHCDSPEGSRDR